MCEIVKIYFGSSQRIFAGINALPMTNVWKYIANSKRHEAVNANLGSCRFINETQCASPRKCTPYRIYCTAPQGQCQGELPVNIRKYTIKYKMQSTRKQNIFKFRFDEPLVRGATQSLPLEGKGDRVSGG